MLPVALYFCVPLFLGGMKKKSSSEANAPTAVDAANGADFVLPAATNTIATPSPTTPGWVEAAGWLAIDMMAIPTEIPASTRNPFAAIVREETNEPTTVDVANDERVEESQTDESLVEHVQEVVAAANPIRQLGLQLNATMVGRRSRLATVNGKTYEEGETIPVVIDAGAGSDVQTTLQLELDHVERRFIVLRLNGQQHRLNLPNELPKDAIVVKPRSE